MGGIEIASVSDAYFNYMVAHETVRSTSENTGKWANVINALEAGNGAETIAREMTSLATQPTTTFGATYDLSFVDNLESRINDFVDIALLTLNTARSAYQDIITSTKGIDAFSNLTYPMTSNRDLFDFFERVSQSTSAETPQDVKTAAGNVAGLTDDLVIEKAGNDSELNGIALWLPDQAGDFNNLLSEYIGFDFSRNTGWQDFIADIFGITFRIELSWGVQPRDLDSHLYDAQNPPRHIYFSAKNAIPGANLDLDDVNGYGPENVRITYLTPGPNEFYQYKVYRYAGYSSDEMSYVRVYRGGNATPIKTYTRIWNDSYYWWNVFRIRAANGEILDIDQPEMSLQADRAMPKK